MRDYYLVYILLALLFSGNISLAQDTTGTFSGIMAKRLSEKFREEHEYALRTALKAGWKVRISDENGRATELIRLEKDFPVYYHTANATAAITTATAPVKPKGSLQLNLTGKDMLIGMWDGGKVRLTHREFDTRAFQIDAASILNSHATHVAGTLIAAGITPNVEGMASQATLHAYDWSNDNAEMISAATSGMLISNHSYGQVSGFTFGALSGAASEWHWMGNTGFSPTEDYTFGLYNIQAVIWDSIMYNAPHYLIVKAAGNDRNEGPEPGIPYKYLVYNGRSWEWTSTTEVREKDGGTEGFDCLPTYSTAKNILTVGSVEDIPAGYKRPADVISAANSSWGPTDDGRIKPDLVGNGVGLYSSSSGSNSQYATLSGTSMAAPNVSGSLLLVQEHYHKTYERYMKASTLKGLAIHTAFEAGHAPGPDYTFGWGLLNTSGAIQAISNPAKFRLYEQTLLNKDTHRYIIYSNGTVPVKATLAWTDVAGTVRATFNDTTPLLVNDLDIRLRAVEAPAVYYPWILDPANPANPATTGDNFRDNIEQIAPGTLPEGFYVLELTHKKNLARNRQDYSLIIESPAPLLSINTFSGESVTLPVENLVPVQSQYPFTFSITVATDYTQLTASITNDQLNLLAAQRGIDTLVLNICSGEQVCQDINVLVYVAGCQDNVHLALDNTTTFLDEGCTEEGWIYYIDTTQGHRNTILAISPNGNTWPSAAVSVNADNNRELFISNGIDSIQVMKHLIHVDAQGSFVQNGGARIRLYLDDHKKQLVDRYPYNFWFSYTGGIDEIDLDLRINILENATFIFPSRVGIDNGVPYAEFENIHSFATFGYIGISSINPLPVTLTEFEAVLNRDQTVSLSWRTATESNNRGFYVEHSTDGQNWKETGFVRGAGSSTVPNHYNYEHTDPAKGLNYYRLRQVDEDLSFQYSPIRSVELESSEKTAFTLYPNPSGRFVYVEGNESSTLQVYNMQGQMIQQVLCKEQRCQIDFSGQPDGLYFISAENRTEKVIIQR